MSTSSEAYFATAPCTDPGAVVLVNPADGTIEVSPEVIDFEWQEDPDYPTFELELNSSGDFTDTDGDGVADDLPLYIPIGQYTQGSAPGLSRYTYDDTERTENSGQGLILPESTYYWRMRGCGPSVCVEGDTEIGPWSNVFSFTTDISRPAPIPKGIRQDITNVSPRRITEMEPDRAVPIIAWTTVTDATGYEVQLTTRETDGEADFTEPMVLELALTALLSDTELSLYSDNPKLFGDNAPVDVLTSEGYLLDGLAGGETYYWRVAALFGEHGQGSWSEPWTFGTAPVSMKFFYYLKDHLGSVRATVNGHGNVVHYDDYYPFGLQMPERTEISDAPLERYTGHELDSETGQYYAGGRYYPSLTGVWPSRDPLDQYASPYVYVGNNPLTMVDPTGLAGCRGAEGESASDCAGGFTSIQSADTLIYDQRSNELFYSPLGPDYVAVIDRNGNITRLPPWIILRMDVFPSLQIGATGRNPFELPPHTLQASTAIGFSALLSATFGGNVTKPATGGNPYRMLSNLTIRSSLVPKGYRGPVHPGINQQITSREVRVSNQLRPSMAIGSGLFRMFNPEGAHDATSTTAVTLYNGRANAYFRPNPSSSYQSIGAAGLLMLYAQRVPSVVNVVNRLH